MGTRRAGLGHRMARWRRGLLDDGQEQVRRRPSRVHEVRHLQVGLAVQSAEVEHQSTRVVLRLPAHRGQVGVIPGRRPRQRDASGGRPAAPGGRRIVDGARSRDRLRRH